MWVEIYKKKNPPSQRHISRVRGWEAPADDSLKMTVRRTVKRKQSFLREISFQSVLGKPPFVRNTDILTPHLKQCVLWLCITVQKKKKDLLTLYQSLKRLSTSPHGALSRWHKAMSSQTSNLQVITTIICEKIWCTWLEPICLAILPFSEHLAERKDEILPSQRLHFNI